MSVVTCEPHTEFPPRPPQIRLQHCTSKDESMVAALNAIRLPREAYTAEQVISRGLATLSRAELQRAVDNGNLVVSPQLSWLVPGLFPAWQFVAPAPSLIPVIVLALRSVPDEEQWTFWSTEWEEFSDLTCAEIICGRLHWYRDTVYASQMDLLTASAPERQRMVMDQIAYLPSNLVRGSMCWG